MFLSQPISMGLYRKRGLLTSVVKEINNRGEILALLEAIWLAERVAIVHCKWHPKGDSPEARGNRLDHLGSGPITSWASLSFGSPARSQLMRLPRTHLGWDWLDEVRTGHAEGSGMGLTAPSFSVQQWPGLHGQMAWNLTKVFTINWKFHIGHGAQVRQKGWLELFFFCFCF